MKVSTLNLLTLLGCAVLAAAVFWLIPRSSRHADRAFSPLAAVPRGAAFVATLDVARLRQSQDGAALVAAGREVPGVGRLGDVCGFDPTAQIRTLVVAVPTVEAQGPDADSVRMGLIATGEFEAARLIECATQVIRKRGGDPGITPMGSFVAVRDRRGSGGSEIAVREQGPVLIGEGPYLRDMIDAADGNVPTVQRDEIHRALRRALGADGTLVATWVPRPGWLERALDSEDARHSPLSRIRAVGLRVDLAPELRLRAIVGCASAEICTQLSDGLREMLTQALAPLVTVPLAAVFAGRLKLRVQEQELHVELGLSREEAAMLTELFMPKRDPQPPLPLPGSAAPRLPPDEVVRPAP